MDSEIYGITASDEAPHSKPLTGKQKLLGDQWKIIEKKLSESAKITLNVLNETAENLYGKIAIEKKNVDEVILNQLDSKVPSSYVTLGNRYGDLRKKITEDRELNKYFKLQETIASDASDPSTSTKSKDKKREETEQIKKRLMEKQMAKKTQKAKDKKEAADTALTSQKKSKKQTELLNEQVSTTLNREFDVLMAKLKSKDTSSKRPRVEPTIRIEDLQDLIYGDKYVELIVLSFISAVNLLTDIQIGENKSVNNEKNKKLYELALGISHLYDKLDPLSANKIELNKITIIDSSTISSEILEDLFTAKENFLRRLDFKPVFLSKNFPQLIFDNAYNKYLNINSIKPYKSQVQVLAGLIDANNSETSNGFLCLLKTLTGEGKTSLIISLANIVNTILASRRINPDSKDMEIIFCCNDRLNTVSYQVGQYAYGMNVPFGMASEIEKTNKAGLKYKDVHVDNNNNCKRTKRLLIIADIVSTARLLEKALRKNKDYVLFFDEPTSFLDENNPEAIVHLTNIFKYLPANVIFSSATLPKVEEIAPFTTYFKTKYPEAKIMSVESSKVKIGCQVNDFNGKLFIPNSGIVYEHIMEILMNKLTETSFVKKLYTPYVVSLLWNNIEKLIKSEQITSEDVENFKVKFGNPCNLNQEAVQDCAINYLEKISKTTNSELTSQFNTYSDSDTIIEEPIDFNKLIKYKGDRFKTQTLIVTKDPIDFVKTYFGKVFEDIFEKSQKRSKDRSGKTFESFYDIFLDYANQQTIYEEKLGELKMGTEEQRIRNQEKIDRFKPIFHFEKQSILGVTYYPEKIDCEGMDKEDNLLLIGLALGVGIYSPTTTSDRYKNEVLNLASEGKLAYIVADTDIAYGTNYAIEHIIIDDTCFTGTNAHSISTLFQVIARAGRVGKSWRAMIYCGTGVINILDNYTKENIKTNEADKINQAVQNINPVEIEERREQEKELKDDVVEQKQIDTDMLELAKVQASLNQDAEKTRIEQQAFEMESTDASSTTRKPLLPMVVPSTETVAEVVEVESVPTETVVIEPVPLVETTQKPPLPILTTTSAEPTKPLGWREKLALKQASDTSAASTVSATPSTRPLTWREQAALKKPSTLPTQVSSTSSTSSTAKPLTWREREALKKLST